MEKSCAESASLKDYEARLGMTLEDYEDWLKNSSANVQRCGGCNRPLIAPPYGVVSFDTYVCSHECFIKAQQEEDSYSREYWGKISSLSDIRGRNYWRSGGPYLPFHKYGVNPGHKDRMEPGHVYLPEMVEEGHDMIVFSNISEAHNYYRKNYEPNIDIHVFWGFDDPVWMPIWLYEGKTSASKT
jgi:hypothetical protein